jgi:dUTP pyrophosphatase
LKVKIKRLHPDAKLPVYASEGAACFDIEAYSVKADGNKTLCGTGLAFEIPEENVLLLFSRSGHGFKHGVSLANCVGVVDSDYRGEVMTKLVQDERDHANAPLEIKPGDRVLQGLILPVQRVKFLESLELSETERGEGGFGSTGS